MKQNTFNVVGRQVKLTMHVAGVKNLQQYLI